MDWQTTFWSDFSIADRFGISAIKDTFNRAFKEWKNDTVYLTELVIVLNLKLWDFYEKGNMTVAKVYNDLWGKADSYAMDNLKGDDLKYFLKKTD